MAGRASAEDVRSRLAQVTDKIAVLDAFGIANKAGNPLTENMVMLGGRCSAVQEEDQADIRGFRGELEDRWLPDRSYRGQVVFDLFCLHYFFIDPNLGANDAWSPIIPYFSLYLTFGIAATGLPKPARTSA